MAAPPLIPLLSSMRTVDSGVKSRAFLASLIGANELGDPTLAPLQHEKQALPGAARKGNFPMHPPTHPPTVSAFALRRHL